MDLGLKGKTALVTGASEGIGSAVARKLAEEGVRVAICARTRAKLEATAAEIAQATQQAIPLHTPGSACNAALRMFSKELSMELGPLNIRVNSLAPGRIQTARADRLLEASAAAQGTSPDVLLGQLVKSIPSGRVGTIDDIGDAVCFLVSERATYINGAALVVDGSKSLVI